MNEGHQQGRTSDLIIVNPDAGGIDVGAESHFGLGTAN
jgi:hypothetical protein